MTVNKFNRKEFIRVMPEEVGVPSEAVDWLIDKLEEGWTEPHGLMLMRKGKVFAEGWWSPYAPGIRHGLTITYQDICRNCCWHSLYRRTAFSRRAYYRYFP